VEDDVGTLQGHRSTHQVAASECVPEEPDWQLEVTTERGSHGGHGGHGGFFKAWICRVWRYSPAALRSGPSSDVSAALGGEIHTEHGSATA
jgi:hypothetical protein